MSRASPTPPGSGDGLLCESLLLAVTGSPAALSMPQYVLLLRQALVLKLRVMMTHAAQQFVRPYTMRLSAGGDWVHTETHQAAGGVTIPHLELTDGIDLLLVMPATANSIAKAANGICDDLVSSAVVASRAPVAFIPAMNESMWRNRAVQRNVGLARDVGYHVVEPSIGVQLADMGESTCAMPPLEHILGELMSIVAASDQLQTKTSSTQEEQPCRPSRTATSASSSAG